MKVERTDRGFQVLKHEVYPPGAAKPDRLVQQSSAIGEYPDSFDRPGSSFLWVGDNHHLSREEVRQFVTHLQSWLDTGYLEPQ